jgi:hypothetical protein
VCNGADNDCDGVIDDGALTTFARDQDLDGRTPAGAFTIAACSAPYGYTIPSSVPNLDCADNDASIYPGALERCDGVDQDCDTIADDAAIDRLECQPDIDGDGFGAGAATLSCTCGAGYAANGDDCDDTEFRRSPGAFEVCDGVDDDCDTLVDNGASCGPDVTQLNLGDDGHSYLFVGNDVDWQTARDWCDARGYTLVRIETGVSGDEQTYLSFTASGMIGDTWWLAYAFRSCDADNEWDHYVGTTCVDDDAVNGVNATEGADLPNGNPNDGAYAFFDGTSTTWEPESILPLFGANHPFICEELP